jgi:hypothetical protein
MDYVTKEEFIDQDYLFQEISQEGKNEAVDKLLEILQWDLTKRHIWARAAGKDGMVLTRCAFAVMVKFNQCSQIVEVCLGQAEIFLSEHEEPFNNQVYKECLAELKE